MRKDNKPGNGTRHAATRNFLLPIALASSILQGCGANLTDDEYLQRARQSIQAGDAAAAMVDLKNALQKNPANADARLLLGQTYLQFGDGVSAEKEFEAAIKNGVAAASVAPAIAKAYYFQRKFDEILQRFADLNTYPEDQRAELQALKGLSHFYLGNTGAARTEFEAALSLDKNTPSAILGLALVYQAAGDNEAAREALEQVLALQPENPEAWSRLGMIEEESDNLDAAASAYTKAIKALPKNSYYQLQKIFLEIRSGQIKEAEKNIGKLADSQPGKHHALGLIAFSQENYKEAVTHFEKALSIAPKYGPAQFYLGLTHFTLGNAEQASQFLKDYLLLAPESDSAASMLATLDIRKGDLDNAQTLLTSVLARDPEHQQALELLAGLKLVQGDSQQAIDIYQRLLSLNPDSGEAHARLGLALIARGQIDEGSAEVEQAIQLKPEDENIRLSLLLAQLQAGKNTEALATAEDWYAAHQKSSRALLGLGWALLANKKPEQAKDAFEATLQISPGNASASQNLATFALLEGKVEQAIAYYEESLKHFPDHAGTSVALATIYQQMGKNDRAIQILEPAWRAHPEQAEPAVLLGKLLLVKGEKLRALQVAQQTAAANPEDPAMIEVLGTAQAENESYLQAAASFNKLTRLQPESAKAFYLLSQVQYRLGDKERFAAALAKAYQLDPGNKDTAFAMAGLLINQGKFPEAETLITRLQTENSKMAETFVLGAQLYQAQKKHSEAATAYSKALALAPDRSDLLVKYGLALWQAGERESAVKTMEDGLSRNPKDLVVEYNLANLYLLADRKDDARKLFESILKARPNHVLALNNLAWLLKDSQPKDALRHAEQAYRLAPDAPAVQDTLGMIVLDQPAQQARALRLLEEAARLAPRNPEIGYHLALALTRNGQPERARQLLTEILESGVGFAARPEAEALLKTL